MFMLQELSDKYGSKDCRDLSHHQLEALRDGLKQVPDSEIQSAEDGKRFIALLRKFREAVAENDKFNGENYPQLLKSLLSVGEDGLYSDKLRFIFELIQNVDDCEYDDPKDCKLDMRFDFNGGKIVLTYNEKGFTPFNVFAITGIAEKAKNISSAKTEIGEKGIGFKSVFGVASRVFIQSGWFSFELYKDNFTIPVAAYKDNIYCPGTQMTLDVSTQAESIYQQLKAQYCKKEALLRKNPLLFLNKLTSLKLYYDTWRSMEFEVSRSVVPNDGKIYREDNVKIAVSLHDRVNGAEIKNVETISCTRYTYPVIYSQEVCRSRYGETTLAGSDGGKRMRLQTVIPHAEDVGKVGNGGLYSFLPTQLAFTVPIVCHAPFKLDASREFVDPQDKDNPGGNLWFTETVKYLAELMDYVFSDWAKTAKQNIVYYLPPKHRSLIAPNNGKERCLSDRNEFKGSHYAELPLFETVDGSFRPASDVFCFDPSKTIHNPVKVAKMLGISKALFLAPKDSIVGQFGITVERNVYECLFRRALTSPELTDEILEYLDSVGYKYSEEQLPESEDIQLCASQLECMILHEKLEKVIHRVAMNAIQRNRGRKISIADTTLTSIDKALGNDFELSDTSSITEQYMLNCKKACLCLAIPEGRFLPCSNGIVLSQNNALSSFAAFCYEMDSHDTFAIRQKFREASHQLDWYVETNSGTTEDYIRALRNIRLTVKDSLGAAGYKNYLDLILKSGTDRTRFIQELLQNADDCMYPNGQIPSFTLTRRDSIITIEYNETGFTRANVRSITAIGESTKDRLLKGDLSSIGEKGVGFKAVFAVASEVKIYSGEFRFALRAEEPTIPKLLPGTKDIVNGTKMEITLRDRSDILPTDSHDILKLCLCLRKLRKMDINGHEISISDSAGQRTIAVDKRTYVFSKYIHCFSVTDKKALEERKIGAGKDNADNARQEIVCYVPEKSPFKDYPLYVGLPTTHKVHIPMAIDAPFALTTSREHIDTGCAAWNGIVRKEMYNAVVKVIHARKTNDRASVLRFARFRFRVVGNQKKYENDLSDSAYLNEYNYLDRLRSERILPTFDKNAFAFALERNVYKYPEAVIILLSGLSPVEYGNLRPETIIDPRMENAFKEQNEHIDAVFNALACGIPPFEKVFYLLQRHVEKFIGEESFRKCLYKYLLDIPRDYRIQLRSLKIIPVYELNGGTQYISWINNEIFVKKNAAASGKSYWVLNEALLSKADCEKILDVNINEMNAEWERNQYRSNLRKIINGTNPSGIYRYLLTEFQAGRLQQNDCRGVLLDMKENIPIKNEMGEIEVAKLFLCNQPTGYFAVKMLQRITVHKECAGLAEFIGCSNLSNIHYEDLAYCEQLTADDIEALQDDYFAHSEEILRGFYHDGYLSDELLSEYNLKYLGMEFTVDSYAEFVFPEQPVRDRARLIKHIKDILRSPVVVFASKVERSVLKGRRSDGTTFELNAKDIRNNTLQIYTPDGDKKDAFCQMCRKLKPHTLMEVNNLELNPRYYFPQTRIALCLECSKKFEALRQNQKIREKYLETICTVQISYEGKVEIPIDHKNSLTFTATHLAEAQELLRKMPK